MLNFRCLSVLLLIVLLAWSWVMFKNDSPKLVLLPLLIPTNNKTPPNQFSVSSLQEYIKTKKQLVISIDENYITNERKLNVLRYEALKLRYTGDSSTVIIAKLDKKMDYKYLLKLIMICIEDKYESFTILSGEFIIIPAELPTTSVKNNKIHSIEL